ncbi:MAG: hypothetical protein COT15_01215 [Candidatus Diapherotrites archaeon CG08_land_8_20_14_0_20_34_12]|nr:MAG: hypothetical protein COT15_01215 [Candidatus Diapherotrites archaeon CG08_land_8_20_14_0_20_34_12]
MANRFEYEAKISRTTDRKKLATKETKNYDYGTINIRKPELAKYIGKMAKVRITIETQKKYTLRKGI